MNVMVTGGAGYIGAHAAWRLLGDGHRVVVVDDLSRGHRAAAQKLAERGKERFAFVEGNVGNRALTERVMKEQKIEAVMHFAAFAAVGESVQHPMMYYRNNVAAMAELLEACAACGVGRMVFSSSCAVYGQPPETMVPIPEDCPKAPISPYGYSKLVGERMLEEMVTAERMAGRGFGAIALRYFNVAGCSRDGVLGEHHDPETHLIPIILQAALGQRPHVGVFGTDYPTPDGTCIRDYIHVEDLVDAHVLALGKVKAGELGPYNLGMGKGYSVREVIEATKKVTGREIRVVEQARRPGDPPRLFADPAKIQRELGWKAGITDLETVVSTAWKWFSANPRGYGG